MPNSCDQCGETINKVNKRFCNNKCKNKFHYEKRKAKNAVEPPVVEDSNEKLNVELNVSKTVESVEKTVEFEVTPVLKQPIIEKKEAIMSNNSLNRLDSFLGDSKSPTVAAPTPKPVVSPTPPPPVAPPSEDVVNLNDVLNQHKSPEKKPTVQETVVDNQDFEPEDSGDRIEIDIKETAKGIELTESANPEKVRAKIPPEKLADTFITGMDVFNMFTAPRLYEKSFFQHYTGTELHAFKQLGAKLERAERKKGKVTFEISEEEEEFLKDVQDFEDYKKRVPMTPEEKKMLKTPLVVLLQEKGADISPGWALIFAVIMMMLPRYSPMAMKGIGHKFFNKQSKTQTNYANREKTSTKSEHSNPENNEIDPKEEPSDDPTTEQSGD